MEDEKGSLDDYQKEMLEIEKEKLETLKGLRKDMKRHQRMESIHKTIEELGIDKEDVIFLVKYVLKKVDQYRGKESEVSEEIKNVISEVVGEGKGDSSIHIEFEE